jgi:hypothetical protein
MDVSIRENCEDVVEGAECPAFEVLAGAENCEVVVV